MVSFDHGCNRIEDKAARNEWNLKSRARLDIGSSPLLFRAIEVREMIQVLITLTPMTGNDGRVYLENT